MEYKHLGSLFIKADLETQHGSCCMIRFVDRVAPPDVPWRPGCPYGRRKVTDFSPSGLFGGQRRKCWNTPNFEDSSSLTCLVALRERSMVIFKPATCTEKRRALHKQDPYLQDFYSWIQSKYQTRWSKLHYFAWPCSAALSGGSVCMCLEVGGEAAARTESQTEWRGGRKHAGVW